jgi:aldehyde dehydrogenase family protein
VKRRPGTERRNSNHRVVERVPIGTVWVNCWSVRDLRVPFGGMKQSGVGREGGEEALRFFTEPKKRLYCEIVSACAANFRMGFAKRAIESGQTWG